MHSQITKNGEDAMPVMMRNALSTFGKQPCAQCGRNIVAPNWSEYAQACRVRHIWQCEACGYEFETTVVFKEDSEHKSEVAA